LTRGKRGEKGGNVPEKYQGIESQGSRRNGRPPSKEATTIKLNLHCIALRAKEGAGEKKESAKSAIVKKKKRSRNYTCLGRKESSRGGGHSISIIEMTAEW